MSSVYGYAPPSVVSQKSDKSEGGMKVRLVITAWTIYLPHLDDIVWNV